MVPITKVFMGFINQLTSLGAPHCRANAVFVRQDAALLLEFEGLRCAFSDIQQLSFYATYQMCEYHELIL